MNTHPTIVLASTSPFRKECLERLKLDFQTQAPGVDETALENESARDLASRLSAEKAAAVAATKPDCVVIAGDQVLEANGRHYGKPGDLETAKRHLNELSGSSGVFHSGMCVMLQGQRHEVVIPTYVTWSKLDQDCIERYVTKEPSPASAGAAQLEKLGISLVERMESDDPSAILGVPLISLCRILRKLGVQVP